MQGKIVFAILVFGILSFSCGKYEEGPMFTILTKKSRVVNTWEVDAYFKNNKEIELPDSLANNTREYKIDGTVIFYNHGIDNIEGEWQFYQDKEYLLTEFKYNDETYMEKARILKLKQKEMWLEVDMNDTPIEYHFVEE